MTPARAGQAALQAAGELDEFLRRRRASIPDRAEAARRPDVAASAEGATAAPEQGRPERAGSGPDLGAGALKESTRDGGASPPEGAVGATGATGAPLRLPHTDWLHHRMAVTGPSDALADFRAAASGAGVIPWRLDGDRLEEDLFHMLAAPPAPQRRRLSLAGARALARQLRDAAELRHAAACGRVGLSRACPFDLHALLPVPPGILRLGAEHPDAADWLWASWGTTETPRRVAVEPPPALRTPLPEGTAAVRLSYWSADWTPWRALAAVRARWPALRFDVRPTYGPL